jgi:GGDEF domain-containing protein
MTAWITLAISLTALAASAVALVTVRSKWQAHARLSRSLGDAIARLAAVMTELNDGLDRLSGETRLTVALDELAEATELEDALVRIAHAATLVSGAQSAVVRAVAKDGRVVIGATHPTPDVAFASEIEWPPTGARAMTFTFLRDRDADGEPQPGSGLALPIVDQAGSPAALVSVLFDEPDRAARAVPELETLAARAAPIVVSLLAAPAAEPPRDLDQLTGFPSRELFHETLARETSRARRQGSPLAVLLLMAEEVPAADGVRHRADADAALITLARCVEGVLTPGAVVCRMGRDELGLVLPAANRRFAELLVARLDAQRSSLERGHEVRFTTGAAELMLTDDAVTLYERAAKSLQAAKVRSAGPDVSGAHEQS